MNEDRDSGKLQFNWQMNFKEGFVSAATNSSSHNWVSSAWTKVNRFVLLVTTNSESGFVGKFPYFVFSHVPMLRRAFSLPQPQITIKPTSKCSSAIRAHPKQ